MEPVFDRAFEEIVMKLEVGGAPNGGYVNDPDDYGGETKYGLTKTTLRNLGYRGEVINLTKDQAKKCYYKGFWSNFNYGQIEDPRIAIEMFDQAIHLKYGQGNKNLQEAYNLLNVGKAGDLKVDGLIGPITLTYVNRYPYQNDLLHLLNIIQGKYYIERVREDPSQEKYFRGWLQRTKVYWNEVA